MRKANDFFKKIFSSLETGYLIKSYFISAILAAIFIFIAFHISQLDDRSSALFIIVTIIYCINFLLFPFAKLVWDLAKDFLFGNHILVVPFGLAMLAVIGAKFIVNIILFGFAIFIAPIGIIIIVIKNRNVVNNEHAFE